MRRLSHRFVKTILALSIPALGAAGCGTTSTTASLASTTTAPTQITEAYSGTVSVKGATTFTFAANSSGSVTAQLKSVSPDSAVLMGLALGTWNGVSCQVVIANDATQSSGMVTGAASAAGNLCVRVYDVGKLTQSQKIEITVTHF
ncbi:MAG: hypothetical protein WCQ64_07700 [Acidobacteriota bacterium]